MSTKKAWTVCHVKCGIWLFCIGPWYRRGSKQTLSHSSGHRRWGAAYPDASIELNMEQPSVEQIRTELWGQFNGGKALRTAQHSSSPQRNQGRVSPQQGPRQQGCQAALVSPHSPYELAARSSNKLQGAGSACTAVWDAGGSAADFVVSGALPYVEHGTQQQPGQQPPAPAHALSSCSDSSHHARLPGHHLLLGQRRRACWCWAA